MNADHYRGFIRDLTAEFIQLTRDPSVFEDDSDFNRGYRAALYSVIHLVENQADAWEIERAEVGLEKFNADDWRKAGRAYGGN